MADEDMPMPVPDGNIVQTERPWGGKIPQLPTEKQLTGAKNFGAFVRATEVVLDAAGISHCIQEGIVHVPLHDKAVKAFLRLNVANHVASMLDGCDTAREMWRKLKDAYLPQTSAQKILLRNKLRNLTYSPKTGIDGLMTSVHDLFYQLRAIDQGIDEDAVAHNVAALLPKEFAPMVGAAIMGRNDEPLRLAELHATLMFIETHLRNTGSFMGMSAVDVQIGAAVCWHCNQPGHVKRQCPLRKPAPPVPGGGLVPRPGERIID
jgi:hypothetical protein